MQRLEVWAALLYDQQLHGDVHGGQHSLLPPRPHLREVRSYWVIHVRILLRWIFIMLVLDIMPTGWSISDRYMVEIEREGEASGVT